jgi:hypothetical protein
MPLRDRNMLEAIPPPKSLEGPSAKKKKMKKKKKKKKRKV